MKKLTRYFSSKMGRRCRASRFVLGASLLLAHSVQRAAANPDGLTVRGGNASVSQNGSQLNITASSGAVLDWQHFNINSGETTRFQQPSSTSVVWNRILDQNPSQILGNLQANGLVVLMNQSGFYFGKYSVVNVGGLIVTTSPVAPTPSGMGGMWQYNGTPPVASIINYGQIQTASGGSLFMVAEKIENHGILSAPDGTLGLYAGKNVLISERPDGRGLSVHVELPEGSVDNTGKLVADAGTIALSAKVVNQNGLIQANSVRERNGVVELVASEAVNLGEQSVVSAAGDATGSSAGGQITIKAGQSFTDKSGSQINVSGGAEGGAGGTVEVSAAKMSAIKSQIIGQAKTGESGGKLLIDPDYITLSNDGGDSAGTGTVNAGNPPGTLNLNVNNAFIGFSQITLQANRDINLATGTVWDLNASTGVSSAGSILSLQAGGDIIFGQSSSIKGGTGWSVQMVAGRDFSHGLAFDAKGNVTSGVISGVGGIYFSGPTDGTRPNGSGSLQTSTGSIQLFAGKEILIGSGFVRSIGGGSVLLDALSGNVDAGTAGDPNGISAFDWLRNGNYKNLDLSKVGGIATTAGGDVNITAGGDIVSLLPYTGTYSTKKVSNVNLTAGGKILGRFQVMNGTGTINAGTDFGSGSLPATLSLAKGSWNVTAGHDVILNEVLNPKGVFSKDCLNPFQFDYALDSKVTLNGRNSVQLMGNKPAVTSDNSDRLPIYAPSLEITAGAGGVHLGNDVILFPSPKGSLKITTTDGGSLHGGGVLSLSDVAQLQANALNYARLIMSDSGSSDYNTFASGHAAIPLHKAGGDVPVQLYISGGIKNLYLQSPGQAIMNVGGNAQSFSFSGQNLSANDLTRLSITGDFLTRGRTTTVSLGDVPNALVFDPTQTMMDVLGAGLSYNPFTHQLTFNGVMTEDQRNFLLHPYVQALDYLGNRDFDNQGNPILVPVVYTRDTAAINRLYQLTQDVPPLQAYTGLQVGGPGRFIISARNMDLGTTQGIRSVGPQNNPNLARISLRGADIGIQLVGDLNMTSSQIASYNGGNINVTAGGKLNVGSQQAFGSDETPEGIYTGHGGNVTINAIGDIEVNGSRIATYDGGNVRVTSQTGSVDAGNGAAGVFYVVTSEINPLTGQFENHSEEFFASGIVTLTGESSHSIVGNIYVSAAKDILANSGGILQIPFHASSAGNAIVECVAGRDIRANLSGIIGNNVKLTAGGDILGLIVASQNISIDAKQSVDVTAVGAGNIKVSGGDSVTGTIVGGGDVSVSGALISAAVSSVNGSTSTTGDASQAKIGSFNGVAAPVAQKMTDDAEKMVADKKDSLVLNDEETKKRTGNRGPLLAKATGRVTVILPNGQ
ncbi:filamentous hemagglutinin N-terminal domain-containing protein [Pedosphaera parvula]|nr:filamentous hemagglutinin N-terminal domain-containing protein [Pedosphaera parvula]